MKFMEAFLFRKNKNKKLKTKVAKAKNHKTLLLGFGGWGLFLLDNTVYDVYRGLGLGLGLGLWGFQSGRLRSVLWQRQIPMRDRPMRD